MFQKVPGSELSRRMNILRARMDSDHPEWRLLAVFSKVSQFYLTGTMQDGVVLIPREGDAVFWIRRSLERARDESEFKSLQPMKSFRDAAEGMGNLPDFVHLEAGKVPLAVYQRFNKHFGFTGFASADQALSAVRSVKSSYELECLRKSGRIHRRVLEELTRKMFREGMSEAEFAAELYTVMVKAGHQGLVRFGMYDTEVLLGHICFGESSIYPTYFNGPGGNYGMSPAVPLLGSRSRCLKQGDLIFLDAGCGVDGYHTDKTMTYVFKGQLPEEAVRIHQRCVDIQDFIASRLKPGAVPSEIYAEVMARLDSEFLDGFMGSGTHQVRFLGHGIGLHTDEKPVLAPGFDEPLQENMVLAVEPKKSLPGIGMVGTENTFLVTPRGGGSLTGNHPGLMEID